MCLCSEAGETLGGGGSSREERSNSVIESTQDLG